LHTHTKRETTKPRDSIQNGRKPLPAIPLTMKQQKRNNPIKKWINEPNKHISKEVPVTNTYMKKMSKVSPSGKCKSKLN
jgi:hypothetical protein